MAGFAAISGQTFNNLTSLNEVSELVRVKHSSDPVYVPVPDLHNISYDRRLSLLWDNEGKTLLDKLCLSLVVLLFFLFGGTALRLLSFL
jgi:hypothetical protein